METSRTAQAKAPVVAIKDRATKEVRAKVATDTDKAALQGFVIDHAGADAMVYIDEHQSCQGLLTRQTVRNPVGRCVGGVAHINGCESSWGMLGIGYHGTFHHVSAEHLDRCVHVFASRHSRRSMHTVDMKSDTVRGFVGKQLTYANLVAAQPQVSS